MKIFILFLVLCGLVPKIHATHHLASYKKHEKCDFWADHDKECAHNPKFMWGDCVGSCIGYAEDTSDNCERWAAEGECTENPTYIHVNCPRSCAYAIAWNPWLRQSLDIDTLHLDPAVGLDNIDSASNVFAAAEIIRDRLDKFIGGLSPVATGLAVTAPSHYLGMMGLTEAVLYSLRLYEVIFSTFKEEELASIHVAKINHVLEVLRGGYSPDKLMLQMPSFLRLLAAGSEAAEGVIRQHSLGENGNTMALNELLKLNSMDLSLNTIRDYVFPDMNPEEHTEKFLSEQSTTVPLLNSVPMPLLGLGTWQLEGDDCFQAVYESLKIGYRMIDTAEAYANEKIIGRAIQKAIKDGLVKREELFIATKLSSPGNAGYENVQKFVKQQLNDLQIKYLDLYMLHSPLDDEKVQAETWRGLEELYEQGLIKSLGVSNFDVRQLTNLMSVTKKVKPMVLQNKLDIYHVGKQIDTRGDTIVSFAKEHKMVMMAYSAFSAYPFVMEPLHDPVINYISMKLSFSLQKKVTPAQIIIKWIVQRGMTVIPRSHNRERLQENMDALSLPNLSPEHMKLIDTLQYLVGSPVSVPVMPFY
jgi:diketogulonate reductase-like aldo/keto reductase